MAKPERKQSLNFLLSHGSGVLLAAMSAATALELTVDDKVAGAYQDFPDSHHQVITPQLKNEPLSPEIIKKIQQSLVTIAVTFGSEQDQYKFPRNFCSGFTIGDENGKPLIVTARHCLTPEKEAKDQPIYEINVTDANGRAQTATLENYYIPINEGQEVSDVVLLKIPDNQPTFTKPLSLNLDALRQHDIFYRISIDQNGQLSTSTLYFVTSSVQERLNFVDLANPVTWVPGTSGSPIVNSVGEVVAVTTFNSIHPITQADIDRYNLPKSYIGKSLPECIGVNSSAIQGLIRN